MATIPQTEYGYNNDLIPRFKWIRYGPTNVSQVSFNPTNTTLVNIRVPALTTVNLAKSYLQYSFQIPAGGAGLWTVINETGCDFSTVQYQTSTALNIVDLSYANKYVHAMQPYRSSLEKDLIAGHSDILTKNRCGFQNATQNVQYCSQDGLLPAAGGAVYAGPQNLLDRQTLSFSAQPNTAVTVNRNIPLSTFVNTFLALNKDIFMPCDTYLNLITAPLYQIFSYSPNPQRPDLNPTLPSASITCNSFSLYLAVEMNQDICDNIKAEINRGPMMIPIPYVYNSALITSSSVSQSSNSFLISKNNGRQLNQVAFSIWNINQNSLLNYDCCNINGIKVASYQTYMDSTLLQTGQMNCFNPNSAYNPLIWTSVPYTYADDWRVNRDWIKGTSILSYPQYQSNFVHFDAFGCLPFEQEDLNLSNQWWTSELSGLSLLSPNAGDHSYSISFNCPGTNPAINVNTNSQGSVILFSCLFSRHISIDASSVYLSS